MAMNELFKGFCLQTQSYKFSSLLPFKHEGIHFFYLSELLVNHVLCERILINHWNQLIVQEQTEDILQV